MKPRISPVSRSVALAFGGLAMALPASQVLAQQQQQLERVEVLERVEITGSRIKRIEAETAAPVQVLTRDDIERTGTQTIQEVLRSITADSTGSIPASFTTGFAAGSAAVSLRGLGVNSTLVLVNGRRMSMYGLADDSIRTFVDLNSLPLDAIERVEVLKDGASAIYGADAIGGVVNVILRKNYAGAQLGASYGQSGDSDGKQVRVTGSYGIGNIDTDKYNGFISLEWQSTDNIWSRDRGFIGQSDLRSLNYFDVTVGAPRTYYGQSTPGLGSPYGITRNPPLPGSGPRVNMIPCDPSQVDPVTNVCRWNAATEREVQPELDRLNMFGRFAYQFTPSVQGYTELGYFQTKMKAHHAPGNNTDGGIYVPGDPFNPLVGHPAMILPASHPDNTFGVDRLLWYRTYELGGRDLATDNRVYRGLVGLQGSHYGWDWDTGLLYTGSKLKVQRFGFIIYDRMQAALNDGTYRITRPSPTSPSPTSPDVLAYVAPVLETEPKSSVTQIDFKAARDLMKLDGGSLGLALGAEYRKETANTPAIPGTETGSIVGLAYWGFRMSRNVWAIYGELAAPVTKWLELNAAVRYDDYSDFGGTWNPKIGFKLRPISQVAFRGTYSEAFRAPGPAEVGGALFGVQGGVGVLSQGYPTIQPETAKSYTLGLILEPVANLSATFDWWKFDRKNEIVLADMLSIIEGLPDSGTPLTKIPGALPNTFIYYDEDGEIGTVTGFHQNLSKTTTDGYDIEVRYRWNIKDVGRFTPQLFWTHVNSFKRTDYQGTTFEYAGTHGPLAQSAGGGGPKDRGTLTMTFNRGPWAVTLAANYVSSITMVDHQGETADSNGPGSGTITYPSTFVTYPDNGQYNCGVFDTNGNVYYGGCKLPAFTTWDLFAKWTHLKNLDLNFSIQNLFDKKAPFDPYLVIPYSINYNQTWHQAGAVGRFYTIGANYTFK
jgi:iron complex outermembrane receptor protein